MPVSIKEDMFERLKQEDAELARKHFDNARKAILRKKDLLDGKMEELGETSKSPREEVKQIMEIIKEVEDSVDSDLLSIMLAFEVDARGLVNSVDGEYALVEELEEGAKKTKLEEIGIEVEEETVLAQLVEHQLNLLWNIHNFAKNIINTASKLENEDIKNKICGNATNLNDISSFLSNLILNEELPNLSLAYNMLKLEGWPELLEKINEIKTRFVEVEPKVL